MPEPLRFFGRVRTFECACPSCGRVVKVHMAHTTQRANEQVRVPRAVVPRSASTGRAGFRKLPAKTWDYRTSRFECPGCHAVYIVGLAFWGVAEGRTRRVPPDTIPTPEQSKELARLDEEWLSGTGRNTPPGRRLAAARVAAGGGHETCPSCENPEPHVHVRPRRLAGATVAEGHHSAYFGEKQWGEAVNVVVEGSEGSGEGGDEG